MGMFHGERLSRSPMPMSLLLVSWLVSTWLFMTRKHLFCLFNSTSFYQGFSVALAVLELTDQAGFELSDLPAFASQVLGLRRCATTVQSASMFLNTLLLAWKPWGNRTIVIILHSFHSQKTLKYKTKLHVILQCGKTPFPFPKLLFLKPFIKIVLLNLQFSNYESCPWLFQKELLPQQERLPARKAIRNKGTFVLCPRLWCLPVFPI